MGNVRETADQDAIAALIKAADDYIKHISQKSSQRQDEVADADKQAELRIRKEKGLNRTQQNAKILQAEIKNHSGLSKEITQFQNEIAKVQQLKNLLTTPSHRGEKLKPASHRVFLFQVAFKDWTSHLGILRLFKSKPSRGKGLFCATVKTIMETHKKNGNFIKPPSNTVQRTLPSDAHIEAVLAARTKSPPSPRR